MLWLSLLALAPLLLGYLETTPDPSFAKTLVPKLFSETDPLLLFKTLAKFSLEEKKEVLQALWDHVQQHSRPFSHHTLQMPLNLTIRERAQWALIQIGAMLESEYQQSLQHQNPRIVALSLWILGEIRSTSSLQAIQRNLTHPILWVKKEALHSFGKIVLSSANATFFPQIQFFLSDPHPEIRMIAFEFSLRQPFFFVSEDLIFRGLSDVSEPIRQSVFEYLRLHDYPPSEKIISLLFTKFKQTSEWSKEAILEIFQKHRLSTPLIHDLLMEALNDPRLRIQRKVAETILSLRDPQGTRLLWNQYRQNSENSFWPTILLARLGEAVSSESLLKYLQDTTFFEQFPEQGSELLSALITWHTAGWSQESDIQKIQPFLLEYLKHPAISVRANAIKALRWFEIQSAIPSLIPYVYDSSREVRFQAIRSLRFLKATTTSALSAYHHALQEKDDYLRLETLQALIQAREALPETVSFLCELLGEKNQWIGFTATWALFILKTSRKTIVKAMIPALRKRVQKHVPPEILQEIPQEVTATEAEILLKNYPKHPYLVIRQAAVRSLRWLGKEGRFATDTLLESLRDSHWFVRWESAWALGYIQDPKTIQALIEVIQNDGHKSPRENAVWALGMMEKTPQTLAVLAQALSDLDLDVQMAAASACVNARQEYEKSIPLLIDALTQEKYYIRDFALLSLGTLPTYPAEVLSALRSVLLFDEFETQRWKAFHLLKKINALEKK